jgi:hypothetical protein
MTWSYWSLWVGTASWHSNEAHLIYKFDYSFFDVIDETVWLAPDKAMQFGKALECILQDIVKANPNFGPIYLMKVDIADGVYHIWVWAPGIVKLTVSIPTLEGNKPLLALPLVLSMGWMQSPPWFCTSTETVTNLANQRLQWRWHAPSHHLDIITGT